MAIRGAKTPNRVQLTSAPAVNTAATVTEAAPGAGRRVVCEAISASLIAGTTAPAAVLVDLRLIDGATGGTTILWEMAFVLQALIGDRMTIALSGLHIEGTADTAMTLEFSAAGGANTFESVNLDGFIAGT